MSHRAPVWPLHAGIIGAAAPRNRGPLPPVCPPPANYRRQPASTSPCGLQIPPAIRLPSLFPPRWITGIPPTMSRMCFPSGRPDPRSEPAPVGRTPGGLAPRAESMPPQTRVAPERGGLAIPDGVFASPAQSAEGVVCDLGHRAGREVPRAHEPRPLDGVTTVGVDPVARLFRNHGRGDDPALIALFRHVALAPIPARAGFVDTDQGLTFRLRLTDALSEVTRSRANGPERGDLSTVIVSDRRHRDGCLMDIQTDVACVRVCHG
jgi:hypothetical protein